MSKNHECSYFFCIVTPTFFVFFGRSFDGEYGATIRKIEQVDFLGRNSIKLSKKNFCSEAKTGLYTESYDYRNILNRLFIKFKSGLMVTTSKDFRFGQKLPHSLFYCEIDYSSYCYISPRYHVLGYDKLVMYRVTTLE